MERPATILIVDDEPPIRRLLRRCFESESYRVLEASDGDEALAALEDDVIDLITLDLNLAGEDGLQVARRMRALSDVAIVMVSGKGELIDKVVGLEVGADDYISKPFELREVLARVRSVLRRTGTQGTEGGEGTHAPLRFAGCAFDPLARELRGGDGAEVELTTAEFELLHLFLRHGRHALSRDAIMDALKGTDWHPNDRTVDNHVARLRRKLARAGVPRAIKTIRGVGYQFAEIVERAAGEQR